MRPNRVRCGRMDRDSSSSLYYRPSLAKMKGERTENCARVYEFLHGIGIVLKGLELSVTVKVVKEPIDFLHKLGLTIEDINSYPPSWVAM
ncbi:hypothetical protein NL676_001992 [Syzygium grande]|nr:hypothetical protein NL676_001992 [Syzygium grande]